jgi:hypothetical protein
VPINIVKINKEDVYLSSPYSGLNIYGEEDFDDIENDKTCLFSFFESGGWGHISQRVKKQLEAHGIENLDELEPESVVKLLDFDGGIAFEYNAGFNGLSWFAFAPAL